MKQLILIIFLLFCSCNNNNNLNSTVEFIKSCWVHGPNEFEFQGEKITEKNCCEACVSLAINKYCGVEFNVLKNQWWFDMRKWIKESDNNKNKIILLQEKLNQEAVKMGDRGFKKMSNNLIKDLIYY